MHLIYNTPFELVEVQVMIVDVIFSSTWTRGNNSNNLKLNNTSCM